MTVKELIEKLSSIDQSKNIQVPIDGVYFDVLEVDEWNNKPVLLLGHNCAWLQN